MPNCGSLVLLLRLKRTSCILSTKTIGITRFLDIVHRLEFELPHDVLELDVSVFR
jgi:hypothetical protein